jgi:HPt (histidine-containing phosphotransfer) domain-containing protein
MGMNDMGMNGTRDSQMLDFEHLRLQTAGDVALQRELLALFETQCARLPPLIRGAGPPVQRADAAHKLTGSARAIGAWRLATVTERLEASLRNGEADAALAPILALLDETLAATRRALAARDRASAA